MEYNLTHKKSKPSQTCQNQTTGKSSKTFLGIINYLVKFSPGTPDVHDPLHKLMLSKVTWTWNTSYKSLFKKAKLLIKSDICMKFYGDTKLLYLETDASGISLGAALLQTKEGTTCQNDTVPDNTILHPIALASKSLTGAQCRYSNIEREDLGILHGCKKFHHYCFAREIHLITNLKLLGNIFKKDVTMLSQWIKQILLNIHQYSVQILYKPIPEIFYTDWLSCHNHTEDKDEPI